MAPLTKEQQDIVLNNTDLIYYVLNKKLKINQNVNYYEDLYQDGCVLLCKVARSYSEEFGTTFSTYACTSLEHHLRGRIREFYKTTFSTSRRYGNLFSKIISYRHNHEYATDEEVCKELGCTWGEYSSALNYYNIVSIDAEVNEDGSTFQEILPAPVVSTIGDAELICYDVLSRIKFKSERDRQMFTDKIIGGLDGIKITDAELSRKYNLSRERVHQVNNKYFPKFKDLLSREVLDD